MPKLSLSVPHNLGAEEAARRLKERFEAVKAEHGKQIKDLQEHWDGPTLRCRFHVLGMSVEGEVTAEASAVRVDARLPMGAILFKGLIETRVRHELVKLLG
jgi:hypothetical protein